MPRYFLVGNTRMYRLDDVREFEREQGMYVAEGGKRKKSDPILSETDLAGRWKVGLRTVQDMRRAGELPPALSIGHRHFRYRLEDIVAFEKAMVEQQ